MGYYVLNSYQQGKITKLAQTPCNPDISVWFIAAVPALMGAFSDFFRPDIKEFYEAFAGESLQADIAKTLAGGVEEGAGFARGIGSSMGGAIASGANVLSLGLRGIAKFAAAYDAASYYAFLASLATDTLINWATGAMNLSGCTPNRKSNTRSGFLNNGACNLGSWGAVADFYYTGNDGNTYLTGSGASSAPGQGCFVACTANYYYLNGFPAPTSIRLIDGNNGQIYDIDSSGDGTHGNNGAAKVWQLATASQAIGQNLICEAMLDAPGPDNTCVAVSGSISWYPYTGP